MKRAATLFFPAAYRRGLRRLGGRIDLLLVVICSLPTVFLGLGDLPVLLWDESRLANNAIEMSGTGWSLVTTYQGNPDLWNTKPPLLIWLIAGAFDLFGPSAWSLRLPSALAALATAMIVYRFCRDVAADRAAGLAGALILLTSYGFVGPHGARSGIMTRSSSCSPRRCSPVATGSCRRCGPVVGPPAADCRDLAGGDRCDHDQGWRAC